MVGTLLVFADFRVECGVKRGISCEFTSPIKQEEILPRWRLHAPVAHFRGHAILFSQVSISRFLGEVRPADECNTREQIG